MTYIFVLVWLDISITSDRTYANVCLLSPIQFFSLLHFRRSIAFGPAFSIAYTLVLRFPVPRFFHLCIFDGAATTVIHTSYRHHAYYMHVNRYALQQKFSERTCNAIYASVSLTCRTYDVLDLSARPSVRPFVRHQTCEQDNLKTNEPISMQIGSNASEARTWSDQLLRSVGQRSRGHTTTSTFDLG